MLAAGDRGQGPWRFTARNPRTAPAKQAEKKEMVEWMLVWLENPEVFPAWVDARKKVRGEQTRA